MVLSSRQLKSPNCLQLDLKSRSLLPVFRRAHIGFSSFLVKLKKLEHTSVRKSVRISMCASWALLDTFLLKEPPCIVVHSRPDGNTHPLAELVYRTPSHNKKPEEIDMAGSVKWILFVPVQNWPISYPNAGTKESPLVPRARDLQHSTGSQKHKSTWVVGGVVAFICLDIGLSIPVGRSVHTVMCWGTRHTWGNCTPGTGKCTALFVMNKVE